MLNKFLSQLDLDNERELVSILRPRRNSIPNSSDSSSTSSSSSSSDSDNDDHPSTNSSGSNHSRPNQEPQAIVQSDDSVNQPSLATSSGSNDTSSYNTLSTDDSALDL